MFTGHKGCCFQRVNWCFSLILIYYTELLFVLFLTDYIMYLMKWWEFRMGCLSEDHVNLVQCPQYRWLQLHIWDVELNRRRETDWQTEMKSPWWNINAVFHLCCRVLISHHTSDLCHTAVLPSWRHTHTARARCSSRTHSRGTSHTGHTEDPSSHNDTWKRWAERHLFTSCWWGLIVTVMDQFHTVKKWKSWENSSNFSKTFAKN